MAKISVADRKIIVDALAVQRAVLVRKARAESNSFIVEIINKDIAALDVLVSFVSSGQLEL